MDTNYSHAKNRVLQSVVIILALVTGCAGCSYFLRPPQATTIYIVRHAEKVDESIDSPLSTDGQERAKELAHVLGEAGIDAIFVSDFVRTQQTAAPLAEALGLTPQKYHWKNSRGVAEAILKDHAGHRVLVVGHSQKVDNIASALGANGLSNLDNENYDRLFVIHRFGDIAYLDRLRYGAKTQ